MSKDAPPPPCTWRSTKPGTTVAVAEVEVGRARRRAFADLDDAVAVEVQPPRREDPRRGDHLCGREDHVRPWCPASTSASVHSRLVVLATGRLEVPLPDHEPEQEVVDRRVAEADRDEQQRLGGDVEVEHVVEQAGGEAEAVLDAERVDQRHRRAGEQRVDDVERARDEHERELERLGDAGEERRQGGGQHDAADELLVLRLGLVPDRQGGGREGEHHDREEAGHERAGGRVAVQEAGDVAVSRRRRRRRCRTPKRNHGGLLRMWCRPSGISSRLSVP